MEENRPRTCCRACFRGLHSAEIAQCWPPSTKFDQILGQIVAPRAIVRETCGQLLGNSGARRIRRGSLSGACGAQLFRNVRVAKSSLPAPASTGFRHRKTLLPSQACCLPAVLSAIGRGRKFGTAISSGTEGRCGDEPRAVRSRWLRCRPLASGEQKMTSPHAMLAGPRRSASTVTTARGRTSLARLALVPPP